MLDFYETILNTEKWDPKKVISILDRIIKLEVLEETEDKYVNDIYNKLSDLGFNVIEVNLNELYREMRDYEFLLLSYQDMTNKFNYILIDPLFNKLVRKNGESPLYFEAWPSDFLQNTNPYLLKNLENDKYSYVDDKAIQDYLRSLTDKQVKINIESLISGSYKDRRRRF
ncbi:MAG: hypothetical protein J6G98_05280 [Bacilli bacterium]|nr:hypothetical protein [Bacilli bacterium]